MLVQDVMQTKLFTVTPETMLPEALRRTAQRGVRPLLVVDGERLVDGPATGSEKRVMRFTVPTRVIGQLGVILAAAIQFHLFLQAIEVLTDFYNQAEHSISARHLYLGVNGHRTLVPWIWTATALALAARVILSVHPLRRRPSLGRSRAFSRWSGSGSTRRSG